jgi:hypothetical protein
MLKLVTGDTGSLQFQSFPGSVSPLVSVGCREGRGGEVPCRAKKDWDDLEDLGVDERIVLKWILLKYYGSVWTECIWQDIKSGGFHKRLRLFYVAQQLLAFRITGFLNFVRLPVF